MWSARNGGLIFDGMARSSPGRAVSAKRQDGRSAEAAGRVTAQVSDERKRLKAPSSPSLPPA